MINSLSQLVLKLTSPGVPDFYRGTELWDLSLVDPDNRRAVDFTIRRTLLEDLEPVISRLDAGQTVDREVEELLDNWPDGRIKLFVTTCGLRFRRAHSELMLSGAYSPLRIEGPGADHLIAFARHNDSGTLLAIVPRLVTSLTPDDRSLPRGQQAWGSTNIVLPEPAAAGGFRHVLTGELIPATPLMPAAALFRTSPVAMLWAAASSP
jgi:(1->4)-alpha-D-glucan 1-alpha-D-glucosylmutase